MSHAAERPVNLGEEHGGRVMGVSASIGVVIYPDEATTAAELLKLADQRMYLSKRHAQKHPQVCDAACSDLEMESVYRRAAALLLLVLSACCKERYHSNSRVEQDHLRLRRGW